MFVDSHCHLAFPELANDIDAVLARMRANKVVGALNICTTIEEFPRVHALARAHDDVVCSVGVHPDSCDVQEPDEDLLVRLADDPRVVAIGETGLDYYRQREPLDWQRERFRTHIRAARRCRKPLIIHTRASAVDTLRIMREECAAEAGGIMHCFTESMEVATAALDMNFHISFSGIVTFKNAADLQKVAAEIPMDRMLVETDSPYLAPVPYRGKTNEPAFVPMVAAKLAELRGCSIEAIAGATTGNFLRLFKPLHSQA